VRSHPAVLSVVLALLLTLATAGAWVALRTDSGAAEPQSAARTSFPDLEPATGAPTLPSLTTLHPSPGDVVEAAGPFDDRFHFERLAFDRATVSGTATITSDVSDVLEFEALAGFYDRKGALLGTARAVRHLDEHTVDHGHAGVPDEAVQFSIRVPGRLRGVAVAAAVGVPVLVNE